MVRILMQTVSAKQKQAQYFFTKSQDRIKISSIFDWVSLRLELKARQNQIENAYAFLTTEAHELQKEDVERFTLFVMQFDEQKNKQKEILLAEKVKNSYSTIIDYENLCNSYKKNQKWHRIPKVAKEWHKKFNDVNALYYLAQSQFHRGYGKKALKTLLKIEKVQDLSINLKRMKADCLTQIADYNGALEIIKEIGLSHQDEGLVVQQANIELTKGNVSEAIQCLRIYVDENERSIRATIMLADLLKKDFPKEAFALVIKL